jgi:outer membrane protein OmpA-like peptidoglycan-associated protein
MVAGGIDAKRVSAAGFGQERPIAGNRSEQGPARRIAGWNR